MVVSYAQRGRWRLATVDTDAGTLKDVPTDLEPLEWLTATPTHAIYIAASPNNITGFSIKPLNVRKNSAPVTPSTTR